jgi:hexosaminidase
MVDQVIAAHPDSLYFHVGLDEVYYKLMHPNCSQTTFNGDFTQAFLSHLTKVAAHVRSKLPKAKILIWDDMLHNMDESVMIAFKPKIHEYEIEPMIWAYMEDVKNWFQPYLYVKYGHIFTNVWAASAYKGASGELTTVTSIQHHYLNHLTWIDVIVEKQRGGIVNFKGIVLTGWSR